MTLKQKLTIGIVWTIILMWAACWDAYGGGKIYSPPNDSKKIYGQKKNLTTKQKINQGDIILPKMVTCRLKKRVKTKSGEEVCIYQGQNKTYEMAIENSCPRQYKCKYNPFGSEPNKTTKNKSRYRYKT